MNKQEQHIEIKSSDDGLIELRYYDKPGSIRYYSWELSLNEANDLAKWWDNGGARFRKMELPVDGVKSGKVLIAMFTLARVEVRAINRLGRSTFPVYSIPRKAVELLVAYLKRG
jgi:hypothetical protein